jgi:prepilin signal peptidase PulO-like enzyme (type II secretory pathway)
VPEKAAAAVEPPAPAAEPRFRRATPEQVRRATRRVLRGSRAHFASQEAFRSAVLDVLREEEPLAVVSGTRLRLIALDTPGVRLSVRYTERLGQEPPAACPVCGHDLRPIRNQTLTGGPVVLGRRCAHCGYWTHRDRRVPVRYVFAGAVSRRSSGP